MYVIKVPPCYVYGLNRKSQYHSTKFREKDEFHTEVEQKHKASACISK